MLEEFIDFWFPIIFALSMGFWAAQTMFTLHVIRKKMNKLQKDLDMISLELRTKDAKESRKDLMNDIQKYPLPNWFTNPL